MDTNLEVFWQFSGEFFGILVHLGMKMNVSRRDKTFTLFLNSLHHTSIRKHDTFNKVI